MSIGRISNIVCFCLCIFDVSRSFIKMNALSVHYRLYFVRMLISVCSSFRSGRIPRPTAFARM